MKAVSGGLKLDLANFRELESFAAVGAERDQATPARNDRGRRLVELLKQANGRPMSVSDQIVSIYAGTNGYLDDVPVTDVSRFEAELIQDVRNRNASMMDSLQAGGALNEDEIKAAVESFKERFVPSETVAAD
jgi:F-type H+-transporting ATPase subunit alpha